MPNNPGAPGSYSYYGSGGAYGYGGYGYGYGYGAAGCALGIGTYPFFSGYPAYAALSYPVFIASGSTYATAAPETGTSLPPAAPAAAAEENAPPPAPASARPSDQRVAGGTTTGSADEPNSLVEALQEELIHRGYLAGAPDGLLRPGTQEALRRFQRNHGLPPTGRVNEATLFALGLN